MRRIAAPALVLGIIGAVLLAFAAVSAPLLTAEPVPSCVKPTGSPTHAQMVTYEQCLQSRTEAMLTNLHPVPTVTETVTATVTATPTATVTPTPTPVGFPDASSTGPSSGTTLTDYTGSCSISADNTVIDSKTIACPGSALLIQARNVTITNSQINTRIIVDTDINRDWSLKLADSVVDAGDGDLSAISNGNVEIVRTEIRGGHNALECQDHSSYCSVKDSWVHAQWQPASGTAHLGGILVLGTVMTCTGNVVAGVPSCAEFIHNTVACDAAVTADGGGCTGNINLLPHFGPLHGARVQDNLFVANIGSSYCTYGGANMENPADHIVYTGNVFQRGTNGQCADFGPVTNFDVNAPGNEWTNNVWDDGAPVPPSL